MLVVDHTYKFIHGMKIPHLTYCNNDQMDVAFTELYAMFKVVYLAGYISMDKSLMKRFPRT